MRFESLALVHCYMVAPLLTILEPVSCWVPGNGCLPMELRPPRANACTNEIAVLAKGSLVGDSTDSRHQSC